MRRLAGFTVASLLFAAVPVFAQDSSAVTSAQNQKDECLLAAKGCADEVDSIQKQMRKLQKEIRKGNRVYTPEELQTLKRKLQEANALLDDLNKPGGR